MWPSVLSCFQDSFHCYINIFVELTAHFIDEETETFLYWDKTICLGKGCASQTLSMVLCRVEQLHSRCQLCVCPIREQASIHCKKNWTGSTSWCCDQALLSNAELRLLTFRKVNLSLSHSPSPPPHPSPSQYQPRSWNILCRYVTIELQSQPQIKPLKRL